VPERAGRTDCDYRDSRGAAQHAAQNSAGLL